MCPPFKKFDQNVNKSKKQQSGSDRRNLFATKTANSLKDHVGAWINKIYGSGKHPDFFKSIFELAYEQGLDHQCHTVTTEDGYRLSLFRIRHPDAKADAPVIFLQHGLMGSGEHWVLNGHKSPAFYFARKGYDVWIGNHRGTKYARSHKTLDPNKDEKFWQFSFEDMGEKDLPAQVDFVRQQTGQKKVAYIGHSQGTTEMFSALATNQAFWKDRISLFVAYAPVFIPNKNNLLFDLAAKNYNTIEKTLSKAGIYELFGNNWTEVSKMIRVLIPGFTNTVLNQFTYAEFNDLDGAQRFIGHFPHGSSVRQIAHYGQMLVADQFQRFDYLDEGLNM